SAPTITLQPTNYVQCAGGSASFTVVASGTIGGYIWFRTGVILTNHVSNSTTDTWTINPVGASDAGYYWVFVYNDCAYTESSIVPLTVNTLPVISSQPTSQTVCLGSSASFSV